MNPTREEALFALAFEKPAADRHAFLDRECASDPALRQRLEALLTAHDAEDSLLAEPPRSSSISRTTRLTPAWA